MHRDLCRGSQTGGSLLSTVYSLGFGVNCRGFLAFEVVGSGFKAPRPWQAWSLRELSGILPGIVTPTATSHRSYLGTSVSRRARSGLSKSTAFRKSHRADRFGVGPALKPQQCLSSCNATELRPTTVHQLARAMHLFGPQPASATEKGPDVSTQRKDATCLWDHGSSKNKLRGG